MTRTDKRIAQIIILLLILTFIFLAWGCKTPGQLSSIQTQLHDLSNQIEENKTEKKVYGNFNKDCDIKQVTFGKDSFSFYTLCPNEAKPLRKVLIKKSYKLVNGD